MSNIDNESSPYTIEGADREYGWSVRVVLHLPKPATERDARAWAKSHGVVVQRVYHAPPASSNRRDRWILPTRRSGRLWLSVAGLSFLLICPPIATYGNFGSFGFGFSFWWQIWLGGPYLLPISPGWEHMSSIRGGQIMFLAAFVYGAIWIGLVFGFGTILKLILRSASESFAMSDRGS